MQYHFNRFSSGKPNFIKALKTLSNSNNSRILNNLFSFQIESVDVLNIRDNILYLSSDHVKFADDFNHLFIKKLKVDERTMNEELFRKTSNLEFINRVQIDSAIIKVNEYLNKFVGKDEYFM